MTNVKKIFCIWLRALIISFVALGVFCVLFGISKQVFFGYIAITSAPVISSWVFYNKLKKLKLKLATSVLLILLNVYIAFWCSVYAYIYITCWAFDYCL